MWRWIKCLWERPMLKAEAWDYLTFRNMSDETFVWVMLELRKDAQRIAGWGKLKEPSDGDKSTVGTMD